MNISYGQLSFQTSQHTKSVETINQTRFEAVCFYARVLRFGLDWVNDYDSQAVKLG